MLTVYSTPDCGWCAKLKEYLDHNHAQYTVIDVSASRDNYKSLLEISGQSGVPVTVGERGEVVIGFDRKKLDELLQ